VLDLDSSAQLRQDLVFFRMELSGNEESDVPPDDLARLIAEDALRAGVPARNRSVKRLLTIASVEVSTTAAR
jgi:hypothetical protein